MSPRVFIVDDDDAVRDALADLLTTAGLPVATFVDGASFLATVGPDSRGCVLLDIAMPGMSGYQVQEQMVRLGIALPVIFITAFGDVPAAVRAMRAGALDFIEKPFDGKAVIARARDALRSDEGRARDAEAADTVRAKLRLLTKREQEVLRLVMTGQSNKEIARALGISFRTVEIHRGRVMRKMQAESLLDLARIARICGIATPAQGPRALSTHSLVEGAEPAPAASPEPG